MATNTKQKLNVLEVCNKHDLIATQDYGLFRFIHPSRCCRHATKAGQLLAPLGFQCKPEFLINPIGALHIDD